MELKYKLSSPLMGPKKRSYKTKVKQALFLETEGTCAKCGQLYNCHDSGESISTDRSNLEIAHIYGLRNFGNVIHSNNKFHINQVSKINSYNNLILLCHKCHKIYDENPNYEDYVNMVKLKKKIIDNFTNADYIYNVLFFCLDNIINVCKNVNSIKKFDYETKTFLDKMKLNQINPISTTHYKMYLVNYAKHIDDFFQNCEENIGINLIASFSSIYNHLKQVETDKNRILNLISRSKILKPISDEMDEKIFDALVSYMIWKCEVLDKI